LVAGALESAVCVVTAVVGAAGAVLAGACVSGYCVVGATVVGAAFVGSEGVVGVAGAVVGAAFGSEGVVGVAGAVVGAAFVEGSAIGLPMLSLTTGAAANGSAALWLATDVPLAICECVSLTTGTLRLIGLPAVGLLVGVNFAAVGVCACGFASGGSGASAWSLGTRRSGIATLGIARFGSGFGGVGMAACRKTAAIGIAYMAASTTRPRPAQ
jgi:hypothetical protein